MSPFKLASRLLIMMTVTFAILSSAMAFPSAQENQVEAGSTLEVLPRSFNFSDWPDFHKLTVFPKSSSKNSSSEEGGEGTRDELGGEGTRLDEGGEGTRSESDELEMRYLLGGEGTRLEIGDLGILIGNPKTNIHEANFGAFYFFVEDTSIDPRYIMKTLLPHLWYRVYDITPPARLLESNQPRRCMRQLTGHLRNYIIAKSVTGNMSARVTADGKYEKDSCSGRVERNRRTYDLVVNYDPVTGKGIVVFQRGFGQ